jgi:putative SOS response-associated peptidase YedK
LFSSGSLTTLPTRISDRSKELKTVHDDKQPPVIARQDSAPIAFAGLWEGWKDPASETLRTFTILPTAANDDMARLQNCDSAWKKDPC